MHNYHSTLCSLLRGNAETCNCADRLTYDQLDEEYQVQVNTIFASAKKSHALYLYTVRDGRVVSRVEMMKDEDDND